MAERRQTIQKEIVKQTLWTMKNHPSADLVYSFVNQAHPNISRATVYRILNQLAEDGVIVKISNPRSSDRYDHRIEEHGHLFCECCGGVFDIEVKRNENWQGWVINDYGCTILKYHLMFEGTCNSCQITKKSMPDNR